MSRTVLVVEDDPEIRSLVEEALQDAGYAVETANGGVEALERVRRGAPDAIVLDMWMPSMDGFDVMRTLRESAAGRAVPVVAISAAYPRRAAEDLGAREFLAKPFEVPELVAAVARALAEP